ncbi:hypothetical protein FKP32DRAFT_292606 [Trametes sanguinea]|nr:hypothetical protein FKP32DRAFT_292606 [Trametes sanguinea]
MGAPAECCQGVATTAQGRAIDPGCNLPRRFSALPTREEGRCGPHERVKHAAGTPSAGTHRSQITHPTAPSPTHQHTATRSHSHSASSDSAGTPSERPAGVRRGCRTLSSLSSGPGRRITRGRAVPPGETNLGPRSCPMHASASHGSDGDGSASGLGRWPPGAQLVALGLSTR